MASLHPEHGARIVLSREPEGAVRYRVCAYLASGKKHEAHAEIADGGSIAGWDAEPPPWVEAFALRLFRGLVKKHVEDGEWPRKVTRWREPLP